MFQYSRSDIILLQLLPAALRYPHNRANVMPLLSHFVRCNLFSYQEIFNYDVFEIFFNICSWIRLPPPNYSQQLFSILLGV